MNHTVPLRPSLNFDDIPDEVLLEIFKWIPFDELISGVKLVNKRWRKVASSVSLYPDILVVTRLSNSKTVNHILSKYSDNLSLIEFQDVYESRIVACLNSRHWSNLRTLSIKWKHHILDSVCLSVTHINWLIDRSPRLIGIELRECFIHGDMNTLVEKLKSSRIRQLTFMNKYLVVDGVEKLFGLRDMTKFQVYCYPLGNMSSSICTFCENNRRTLTTLALRIDDRWNEGDDVINAITSCSMLCKLNLIGQFNVSKRGLRKISSLVKLKCLKIEVYSIDCDEFAMFLNLPFSRQLTMLAVHWSRPVTREELSSIINCRDLSKLTLMFSNIFNDTEMIRDVVIQVVKALRLKKLKIISNFFMLDCLPEICSQSEDLFCIELIHGYEVKYMKYIQKKMQTIGTFYEYEYSVNRTELRIAMRKKKERINSY